VQLLVLHFLWPVASLPGAIMYTTRTPEVTSTVVLVVTWTSYLVAGVGVTVNE
jgi:hypothetical protein